jgi:hypothetical protein
MAEESQAVMLFAPPGNHHRTHLSAPPSLHQATPAAVYLKKWFDSKIRVQAPVRWHWKFQGADCIRHAKASGAAEELRVADNRDYKRQNHLVMSESEISFGACDLLI